MTKEPEKENEKGKRKEDELGARKEEKCTIFEM